MQWIGTKVVRKSKQRTPVFQDPRLFSHGRPQTAGPHRGRLYLILSLTCFCFQWNPAETKSLLLQSARAKGLRGRRTPPHAFTEQASVADLLCRSAAHGFKSSRSHRLASAMGQGSARTRLLGRTCFASSSFSRSASKTLSSDWHIALVRREFAPGDEGQ
jgi:hypothetical protein